MLHRYSSSLVQERMQDGCNLLTRLVASVDQSVYAGHVCNTPNNNNSAQQTSPAADWGHSSW
jgi:hypothetical protein